MIRKRGKTGQPVKNGTRYKKCTLDDCDEEVLQHNSLIKRIDRKHSS